MQFTLIFPHKKTQPENLSAENSTLTPIFYETNDTTSYVYPKKGNEHHLSEVTLSNHMTSNSGKISAELSTLEQKESINATNDNQSVVSSGIQTPLLYTFGAISLVVGITGISYFGITAYYYRQNSKNTRGLEHFSDAFSQANTKVAKFLCCKNAQFDNTDSIYGDVQNEDQNESYCKKHCV